MISIKLRSSHTSVLLFSCKFAAYFHNTFFNTSLEGSFWNINFNIRKPTILSFDWVKTNFTANDFQKNFYNYVYISYDITNRLWYTSLIFNERQTWTWFFKADYSQILFEVTNESCSQTKKDLTKLTFVSWNTKKVNIRNTKKVVLNTKKMVWNMYKVNNKNTRMTTSFWCFYC